MIIKQQAQTAKAAALPANSVSEFAHSCFHSLFQLDYISGLMKEMVNKGIEATRNFQDSVLELVGVILGRTLALPE